MRFTTTQRETSSLNFRVHNLQSIARWASILIVVLNLFLLRENSWQEKAQLVRCECIGTQEEHYQTLLWLEMYSKNTPKTRDIVRKLGLKIRGLRLPLSSPQSELLLNWDTQELLVRFRLKAMWNTQSLSICPK